ncbi:MAG: 3-dehydroquinate synthase [Woeseiaceae bacterium]|nr:3-dehydroquinate synthase [Woeseiaceae bacterium]
MHQISVDLGDRSYPIVIGSELLSGGFDLSPFIAGANCLVVTNETVGPLYEAALLDSLCGRQVETLALPDGEQFKTLDTMVSILDRLTASGFSRDTTLIALGGGVVGDITGFAAACYMRGVDFIQVPTTLLAQVDSSVGGKTGVNHAAGKNLVGAFHQPRMVMIDTNTLSTLPERQMKAGLAEVIKYGAIADLEFLAWLEDNMQALLEKDAGALAHAIRRSCELKAEVVSDDEREAGRRAILNFGHTFGHAIERCQGYGDWLHGEAVAAGMVMAAELSGLPSGDVDRLRTLIETAGLPVASPDIGEEAMRDAMGMDKKVRSGQLRFVLLESLGHAVVSSDYDDAVLSRVLSSAA